MDFLFQLKEKNQIQELCPGLDWNQHKSLKPVACHATGLYIDTLARL